MPERRWCRPSPRKPGPLFPGRAGEETAPRPGERKPGCAPALPLPRSPSLGSRLSGRQSRISRAGRAAARPPWEDEGARFLLLPPAPRAEAVAKETRLAVRRGARPLPRPVHLRGLALAAPRPGEGQSGRGAAEGPPNPPAGQGRDTGGTKTPGTTRAAAAATTGSASPEARPLVGSCHSPGYAPSLLSTDLSLPPRRPAIPLQLRSGSAPSPIGYGSRASVVPTLTCPMRKGDWRELVPGPKTA